MRKMKTMQCMAIAALVSAGVGLATLNVNVSASAEMTTVSGFTMVSGASVRMDETANESGIRFAAKVPAVDSTDYRMLIVPTVILKANNIEAGDNVVAELKAAYSDYEAKFNEIELESFFFEELNANCIVGAINYVPAARYAEEYTAVAYYMDGETYVYASFEQDQDVYSIARSVSYVGSVALEEDEYVVEENAELTAKYQASLEAFVGGALENGAADLIKNANDNMLKIGDEITLTTGAATKLSVQYASDNQDVATVENGVVSIIGEGTANVTATIGDSFSDTFAITAYDEEEWTNRLVATNYSPEMRMYASYYNSMLRNTVEDFNTEFVAPQGTSYTSYVDYTLTPNNTRGNGDYLANFLNFSDYLAGQQNTRVKAPISSKLYNEYKSVDWTNAYITFWLYNGSNVSAKLYGTLDTSEINFDDYTNGSERHNSTLGEIATVEANSWKQFKISMNGWCGVSSDVFATGTYNVKIWLTMIDTSVTADNMSTTSWNFRLAGFEIRNLTDAEKADAMNNAIVGNYSESTKFINRNERGALSTAVTKFDENDPLQTADVAAYTTYINYTMTSEGGKSNGRYRVNFLNFSDTVNTRNKKPMTGDLLDKYKGLDWANASVSFFFYFAEESTTISGLELRGTQPTQNINYSSTTNVENVGDTLTSIPAKTWRKVTFKLSEVCPDATQLDVANGNYNIKLWLEFIDSAYTSSASADAHAAKTWNFYMTGFEFIAGEANA